MKHSVAGLSLSTYALLLFVQNNRSIIENLEVWRLFTSIFLHADPMHIFSNMIALLLFGATVENNNYITKLQYLIIYFVIPHAALGITFHSFIKIKVMIRDSFQDLVLKLHFILAKHSKIHL